MSRPPRIAWFHPAPAPPLDLVSTTAPIAAALAGPVEVVRFDAGSAGTFDRMHLQDPFDLTVFELENTRHHDFVWPYLLRHPGVVALGSTSLDERRRAMLLAWHRDADYVAERAFDDPSRPSATAPPRVARGLPRPMLRVPLVASRLTVVSDVTQVALLERAYPGARIRHAPFGLLRDEGTSPPAYPDATAHSAARGRATVFGVLDASRLDVVRRALERARGSGTAADLLLDGPVERVLRDSDAVVALRWPASGELPVAAVLALAAGKPVILLETERTAAWPLLDPQTWQPRGADAREPIGVSVDLRDEEHSLMLAMRRLAADAALRVRLGQAARDWAREHARLAPAVAAWQEILADARSLAPPPPPADWPGHLGTIQIGSQVRLKPDTTYEGRRRTST